jgi:hypothetical protein
MFSCSKNRLAPVNKGNLPLLELLVALVGSRVLQYFCRETQLDINNATSWTDATVVLSWIRSNLSRWKTLNCNRAREIPSYTTPTHWKNCPGEDSLADYLSRVVNSNQLKALDAWCRGPAWLSKGVEFWAQYTGTTEQSPPEEGKNLVRF